MYVYIYIYIYIYIYMCEVWSQDGTLLGLVEPTGGVAVARSHVFYPEGVHYDDE